MTAAWKKLRFILSVRSDFHIIDSLLIAVHAFVNLVLMSVSIYEYVYIRICMHIYVYICICIYIYVVYSISFQPFF